MTKTSEQPNFDLNPHDWEEVKRIAEEMRTRV